MNTLFRIVLCALLCVLARGAAAEVITHNQVADAKEVLLLDILKLALSKSAPGMQYQPTPSPINQARALAEIKAGNLSVMWAGTTPEYERELKPVRIPVLKGMLGHRIFIIKQGKQPLFDQIKTLDDLRQLKAGQGRFWGDTQALQNAQIPTVTTIKYHNLFHMLEGDRFDYFPRAVHEPWEEVSARPELKLTVEKRILLVYPFAMYYFVAPDNQRLHDLIYSGMEQAIIDGSFDKLFFSHPMVKDALERSNLGERIVFRIPNPNMHPDTPFDRKEFWLDLNEL